MRNNDPYGEKYGRHSSFRAGRDADSSGLPLGKWLLVVFLVTVAVLGFERWRKRAHTPPVAETVQPLQESASPPPVAAAGEPAIVEKEPFQPVPMEVAGEISAAPDLPARILAVESAPPPVVAEKPETEVRYEMKMNRGNHFVGQGSINGKDVTLLADTGATTVVVPEKIAQRLGLKRGPPLPFHTAGGDVIHFATTLDTLTLGRIEISHVPAAISPVMNVDFILLGMSALKLMDMEYGEGKLVLKHKQEIVSKEMRTVGEENFKRPVKDCAGQGNKFDQQSLDCLRGR